MKTKLLPLLLLAQLVNFSVYCQLKDTMLTEVKTNGAWRNANLFATSYNDDCLVVNGVLQLWDANALAWTNVSSDSISYDEQGRTIADVGKAWIAETQSWKNSSLITYDYTANGYDMGYKYWDEGTQSWLYILKVNYTFDDLGSLTSFTLQYFIDGAWLNQQQSTSTYNADHRLDKTIFTIWDNNRWLNNQKHLYRYSTAGSQVVNKGYAWSTASHSWYDFSRQTSSQIPNTELVEESTYKYFSQEQNNWVNGNHWMYAYTSDLFLRATSFETWNLAKNTWKALGSTKQDYYADGSIYHKYEKNFNTSTNAWEDVVRHTTTHNGCILSANITAGDAADNDNANLTIPGKLKQLNGSFNNSVRSLNSRLPLSYNIWLKPDGEQSARSYNISLTAKPNTKPVNKKAAVVAPVIISKSNISLSPNPASTYVNVYSKTTIKQVQIISATGQLLKTVTPNATSIKLQIANLIAGEYFLRIKTDAGISNEKFIKR